MFPEILPVLLSVVVISLTGVMMPGPMFAVTLAKSFRSPWVGAWISLGHAVIEVPIILLIYFGFAHFFDSNVVQLVLSILGGGMVIWLGIGMFRARAKVVTQGKDLPYNAFTAGVVTSGLNPFFILWWSTLGSLLVMKFVEFGAGGLALFIIIHWLCDLLWLSLVAVVVYRTHALWGKKVQESVFIASSLLLTGFGIWFMVSGFQAVF
ncbi:MAG: LysE family transporter [Dehalococcoidia bacterium]|nr:MAG: LysE family transporter [Dehalococcoidia bacterium]